MQISDMRVEREARRRRHLWRIVSKGLRTQNKFEILNVDFRTDAFPIVLFTS